MICDYDKYINIPNSVFVNNALNVDILSNKCLFAKFMMQHFPNNIPKTLYYSFGENTYIDQKYIMQQKNDCVLISKPVLGSGGAGIKIVSDIDTSELNVIISEYIDHNMYCVGHVLVNNGKILKIIYFITKNYICRGAVSDYEIVENINVDTDIFNDIFYKLNYSGFACINFCISDNIVKIFEINPRIGKSLYNAQKYLFDYIKIVIDHNL